MNVLSENALRVIDIVQRIEWLKEKISRPRQDDYRDWEYASKLEAEAEITDNWQQRASPSSTWAK